MVFVTYILYKTILGQKFWARITKEQCGRREMPLLHFNCRQHGPSIGRLNFYTNLSLLPTRIALRSFSNVWYKRASIFIEVSTSICEYSREHFDKWSVKMKNFYVFKIVWIQWCNAPMHIKYIRHIYVDRPCGLVACDSAELPMVIGLIPNREQPLSAWTC